MKKFVIIAVILVALIAGFIVLSGGEKHIETVSPTYTSAVQAVYATGTVEPVQMIPISPKMSARIVSLESDEGHAVTQGQMLAQLESEDMQQSLIEAEARLTQAQREWNRSQTLGKTGAISKSALDNARATFESAKAGVERIKAELSYLQLIAPEAGTIIRRDGEVGELATPQNPVFWMIGGNQMRVETEVDEEDIALVKPGQEVAISADAFPGQIFKGEVLSITPKGDPVARSYRVRVSLEENSPLMIGMTAETNIITQKKDKALMVPLAAVKGDEIWIKRGQHFEKQSVTTGIKTDTQIEILSGVGEGEDVAVRYDDASGEEAAEDTRVCNMGTGC